VKYTYKLVALTKLLHTCNVPCSLYLVYIRISKAIGKPLTLQVVLSIPVAMGMILPFSSIPIHQEKATREENPNTDPSNVQHDMLLSSHAEVKGYSLRMLKAILFTCWSNRFLSLYADVRHLLSEQTVSESAWSENPNITWRKWRSKFMVLNASELWSGQALSWHSCT